MSEYARGVARGVAVMLLVVGLFALGLGIALREAGILGMLFQLGGAYLVLQGVFLLIEARFRR